MIFSLASISVGWDIYIPVSAVMFLEYAVWGAWAPVLAARLLGPLKMSGKQTGWIYATLPLGCMISPLVAGQVADKWVNLEWILAASHLIGAVLLFMAARCGKFTPMFIIMLLYSFFYAATLPLVNAVLFAKISDVDTQSKVFVWAPVGWALIGYLLTSWRWIFKTEGQGRDCLYLASILSVAMGVACMLLPATKPAGTGEIPIVAAMRMLGDPNFLVFIIVSMAVVGTMQFYFLGTARFMQDIGIKGKNVPLSMAIAQTVQAVATLFVLGFFLGAVLLRFEVISGGKVVQSLLLGNVGFKWTLIAGTICWAVMYLIYVATKPRWLVIGSQALHGVAFMFFVIGGQIVADAFASPEILNSMQGLIFFATMGVGLFFGTQFAGITMDACSSEGKVQWRKMWSVPLLIVLIGALVLLVMFSNPATT